MMTQNGKVVARLVSGMFLLTIELMLILDVVASFFSLNQTHLLYVSIIVLIASYVYLFSFDNYEKLGFHSIIFMYTWLAHLGFLFAVNINYEGSRYRTAHSLRFENSSFYTLALEIALIAIIAYALSASTRSIKNTEISNKDEVEYYGEDDRYNKAFFGVCIAILFFAVIYFGYIALTLRGSLYGDNLEAFDNIPGYINISYFTPLAYVIIVSFCDSKKIRAATIVYVVISIAHFSMGNRGEVLYAWLTALAAYQMRFHKIKLRHVAIGGIALVLLIPLIRVLREGGTSLFTAYSSLSEIISSTLAELGFQISTLTYTLDDLARGDTFKLGGTYLYGVANFLLRRLPFLPQLDQSSFLNMKNVLIQYGTGYGCSQITETYYNFGLIGSTVIYFLFGRLTLSFEKKFVDTQHVYKKVFVACFMVELVNLTRNSSGTIIYFVVFALILIFVFALLTGDMKKFISRK